MHQVNNYFAEGMNEQRSSGERKLLWFHRTLSSYVRALREQGFMIDDIIEPEPNDEAIKAHQDFIHFKKTCHFIVFRVLK